MSKFWRAAVIALALNFVVSLVNTSNIMAAEKLIVKGDAKAWAEIEAAYIKQNKVKSYRAKGTMSGAGVTIEFVTPDRWHTKMDTGGFAMETIMVGNDIRFRQGGGPWQCTGQAAEVPMTDPGKMSGEVTASKGPAVTVDGVQTQSYTYTWKIEGIVVTSKIFIAVSSGFPKRIQMLGDKGEVEAQYDYDYNAPITITLPPCK